MKTIFICAPYRADKCSTTYQRNLYLKDIARYCRKVMDEGNVPVAPSLYFSDFVNEKNVLDRSTAKKMTHRLLLACEEVYVFGDKTKEMKEILEEAQAEAMKITDVPLW